MTASIIIYPIYTFLKRPFHNKPFLDQQSTVGRFNEPWQIISSKHSEIALSALKLGIKSHVNKADKSYIIIQSKTERSSV